MKQDKIRKPEIPTAATLGRMLMLRGRSQAFLYR